MKVKQRFTCQTCRERKLGCDGKSPECSQCMFSGRRCDGYSTEWTFIHDTRSKPRKRGKEGKRPRMSQDNGHEIKSLPCPTEVVMRSDDFVTLIVRSYMPESELEYISDSSDTSRSRICGSWVETLPELLQETSNCSVLYPAANALAMAIGSPSSQTTGSVACTQTYSTAIQALQKGFLAPDSLCPAQLMASVMCLGLVEVMFPDSSLGLAAHFNGIEQLFQANGPEKYSSGVLHKLFVGFRPLLILQALQTRRSTFLAGESWITTPFATFSPSPMQSLLNKGLTLTTGLQEIDILLASNSHTTLEAAPLVSSLLDMRSSLEKWESSFRNTYDGAPYWPIPSFEDGKSSQHAKTHLWFPNITHANVYTHLWAFHIICLSELEKVIYHFPSLILEHTNLWDKVVALRAGIEMVSLAEQICSSMDYLLQDEMGLFGPGSTFLPLLMAYRAFKKGEDTQCQNIIWIQKIVDRLVAKGLRSAPAVIYQIR
ncbi:hypothetical protein BDV12DRAFT_20545 [Aspergillus spectabilis]